MSDRRGRGQWSYKSRGGGRGGRGRGGGGGGYGQQQRHPGSDVERGDKPLEVGCRGFVFTFAGLNPNPKWAIGEARRLLETYVDKLKPELVAVPVSTTTESNGQTETAMATSDKHTDEHADIADCLAKEVGEMKEEQKQDKSTRPFGLLTCASNVKNVLVIDASHLLDVSSFTHSMVSDLQSASASFVCKTLQRVVPFDQTCKTAVNDLQGGLELLIPKAFERYKAEHQDKEAPSYGVFFKARHTDTVDRGSAIDMAGEIVKAVSPLSRADLKTPDLSVLIEILANRTCLSVLPDYLRLKKFSLQREQPVPALGAAGNGQGDTALGQKGDGQALEGEQGVQGDDEKGLDDGEEQDVKPGANEQHEEKME